MLPPDNAQYGTYNRINSVLQLGRQPAGEDDHGQLRHPDQPRRPGRLRGLPGRRQRAGRHLPRLPLPGQGRLLGPRTSRRRVASCSTAPRPWPWPGPATTSTTPTATGTTTGRATSAASSARTCSSRSLISAAKSKVNPLTVNAFIGSIHEGVTIDDGFGFNELIGLALTYHSFDPADLGGQTLPTVAANGFGDLGDVLTVDQPEAQQMLVNIFGSSLVAPDQPAARRGGQPQPAAPPSRRRRWLRPPPPRARPRRRRRTRRRPPPHRPSTRRPAARPRSKLRAAAGHHHPLPQSGTTVAPQTPPASPILAPELVTPLVDKSKRP